LEKTNEWSLESLYRHPESNAFILIKSN